jgi:hypothetical protein
VQECANQSALSSSWKAEKSTKKGNRLQPYWKEYYNILLVYVL